mgnify:CR=1 FL=1
MSITTKEDGLELFFNLSTRIRNAKINRFQKKKVFEIEVLEPYEIYSNPAGTTDTSALSETGSDLKYIFKGRILNRDMAHNLFLNKPKDSSISNDNANSLLTVLHSNIIFSKKGAPPDIKVGDVVLAETEPGDNNNLYNLQFLRMRIVEIKSSGNISQPESSSSLLDLFSSSSSTSSGSPDVNGTPSEEEKEVHLVYWYGGQPPERYGSDFILHEIERLNLSRQDTIIYAANFDDEPQDVINAADQLLKEKNATATRVSLGAWSGGAAGAAKMLAKRPASDFDLVYFADPAVHDSSTYTLAEKSNNFSDNIIMTYNLSWWDQTYGVDSTAEEINQGYGAFFQSSHWERLIKEIEDKNGSVVNETRYNGLVRKAGSAAESLGNFNISVEAHAKILEDALKFVIQG